MSEGLSFLIETVIPANPEVVFDAWLSSEGHGAMTGATAEASAEVGAVCTAWDGYIKGVNLTVSRPRLLVQRWRTMDFTDDEPDSILTVRFSLVEGGCRVAIRHETLPAHGGRYEQGWVEHYFQPMTIHFAANSA